jgi:hypothetical protein
MAAERPRVKLWQPERLVMAAKGRVEGKVVLVTGAGHGLGQADAEALAREGARVVVADVDEQAAWRVADALPAAMPLHLDVTCETRWRRSCRSMAVLTPWSTMPASPASKPSSNPRLSRSAA